MRWLKRIIALLGVIILILAAVPFFITLDDYIPAIEEEVSARLREPVKIGSLRVAGLPLPHLMVRGVTVGATEDIKVGTVTVTPDLRSLLETTRVIRSIEINGLVLTQNAVDRIPAWIPLEVKAAGSSQPPAVRVEAIKLDDVVLKLEKATLGPFDAQLSLTPDGALGIASIVSRDGNLKALVKPQHASYLVEIRAKRWTPPLGPRIHFDDLVAKGVATLKGASFSDISAQLYGGALTGRLVVGWQKGVQVRGSANVSSVDIAPLLKALDKPENVSGRINARPDFSAQASSPEQILDALRLDTPFGIDDGVLHGIDIRKAATFSSEDGGKGGETRFDRLRGQLSIDRGTRRLTRLDIASGSLSADGNVTISPQDQLSGRLNTSIKAASIAAVSVPLNVSGTLESPLLYPTGGTVAGAVAGTAVLGPGVGTAVGARIGQWFENLFGKKDEEKQ